LAWLISAVAAVVLPFRRKSIFEGSQNTSRFAGFPVISWIGVVSLVVLGYLSYNAFTNPAIGPGALGARLLILAIVAVSVLIYSISYYYHKGKGLDLSTLSKELPPE
jgi:hypothetical protein